MKTNKQAAYTVTQFTGQTGFFLVHNRPMGGKFILAKFDSETTEEGRNMVANACNGHAALVTIAEKLAAEKGSDLANAHERLSESFDGDSDDEEHDAAVALLDELMGLMAEARLALGLSKGVQS